MATQYVGTADGYDKFIVETSSRQSENDQALTLRDHGLIEVDLALMGANDALRIGIGAADTSEKLYVLSKVAKKCLDRLKSARSKKTFAITRWLDLDHKDRVHRAVKNVGKQAFAKSLSINPAFAIAWRSFAEKKKKVGGSNDGKLKQLGEAYQMELRSYTASHKEYAMSMNNMMMICDLLWRQKGDLSANDKKRLGELQANMDKYFQRPDVGMGASYPFSEDEAWIAFELAERYNGLIEDDKFKATRVVFFDKFQRLKHLKVIMNGKLYGTDGELFVAPEPEAVLWAMDRYGNIYVCRDWNEMLQQVGARERFNHSSLNAGKGVICAGCLNCDTAGKLTNIRNDSGHYKPTAKQFQTALKILSHAGLDLTGVKAYVSDKDLNWKQKQVDALRFIAAKGSKAMSMLG